MASCGKKQNQRRSPALFYQSALISCHTQQYLWAY